MNVINSSVLWPGDPPGQHSMRAHPVSKTYTCMKFACVSIPAECLSNVKNKAWIFERRAVC